MGEKGVMLDDSLSCCHGHDYWDSPARYCRTPSRYCSTPSRTHQLGTWCTSQTPWMRNTRPGREQSPTCPELGTFQRAQGGRRSSLGARRRCRWGSSGTRSGRRSLCHRRHPSRQWHRGTAQGDTSGRMTGLRMQPLPGGRAYASSGICMWSVGGKGMACIRELPKKVRSPGTTPMGVSYGTSLVNSEEIRLIFRILCIDSQA